ncbi:multidrug efflux pump [Solimonas aquatica]|uniref:Multidrug efflux pump n=1 Tax=Solimonas aquatica TaxID=489703 RepID=A0A1H9HW99_9GAMM|nr:efflux RND transporter permease subunit [Solimonas aquatica]SEQ66594.1 multidrug efflux pump [Solimonas aquatica]
MSFSAIFIRRPVATTLLTLGVALAGLAAFTRLPVAALPQVDFPTIAVTANMAGASPETMAATVATPLERHLGTIADVTEMSSQSSLGSTRITLQFDLSRDIDGAARDVQAAINAARVDLPVALKSNPTYRKMNPADMPILILALTSPTLSRAQIYDAASTVVQQRLSQVSGVGQVDVSGASAPAVRVELNPEALFKYGIGLEDVRSALSAANANSPKGAVEGGGLRWQIYTNDRTRRAADYQDLLIAYRKGVAVRLTDVAEIRDSVENVRNEGLYNGRPAVLVLITKQPGANVIATIDQLKALLPQLQAALPASVQVSLVRDSSLSIRRSLHEVEVSLLVSVLLVVLVVFLFLRDWRATLIPSVAVPVSLLGTFGVMLLLGYSLNNLSLMALTIATGFVVDDAVVVLENISRHLEAGKTRLEAALQGAREIGFTVLSMSLSLVAVFLPILLMSGMVGRLFREFAVVLAVAVLVSLLVSLVTTPMMCARLLKPRTETHEPRNRWGARLYAGMLDGYRRSLGWALDNAGLTALMLLLTVLLNIWLFIVSPKGFFPSEDNGSMMGNIRGDQSISFQAMRDKLQAFAAIVKADPAVQAFVAFTGGRSTNSGTMFITLKPLSERKEDISSVIARLRQQAAQVPGARLFFMPEQTLRVGGRQANSTYQYTLQADDTALLREWTPKLVEALQDDPVLLDVNSDQQDAGLQTQVQVDRLTAARLGLNARQIDNTLYDAFGQRTVSTIYDSTNQYSVVMELAPRFLQSPETLKQLWVSVSGAAASGTQSSNAASSTYSSGGSSASGSDAVLNAKNVSTGNTRGASTGSPVSGTQETMVPLSAFATLVPGSAPLAVNHQGQFAASTLSFDLAPKRTLAEAEATIRAAMLRLHVPASIHGGFAGTARTAQDSSGNTPLLILAALAAVYVVLGMLYESYVHPLTILSTLPSAGVGALLALLICGKAFTLIALIGIILLIGIVKKNAIMMIDFALEAERSQGLSPREAIYQACLLRFRPIMMTTLAAMFGALPLALATGMGAELRRPLGIAIVGGLLLSQALTLYTTPVIYLYLDRFRHWSRRRWQRRFGPPPGGSLELQA